MHPAPALRPLAQTWNPVWSVSSILVGMQSFMMETSQTVGSIETSTADKARLAAASLAYNRTNKDFCRLFPELLERAERKAAEAAAATAAAAAAAAGGGSGGSSSSSSSGGGSATATVAAGPAAAGAGAAAPAATGYALALCILIIAVVLALMR